MPRYNGAFFMPCMLLTANALQGIVRKLFVPSSGLLWGFFANLRTNCEEVANLPRLSLYSVPKKTKRTSGCKQFRRYTVGKQFALFGQLQIAIIQLHFTGFNKLLRFLL